MEATISMNGFLRRAVSVGILAAGVSACALSPAPPTDALMDAPIDVPGDIHAPVGATALIQRHGLSGAETGFQVIDLDTGQILAAMNEERLFIPASTAKVPATLAALNILGPEYRFHTSLLVTGNFDKAKGVLDGDLYLQGGAEPLLRVSDLMALAGRLKDLGLSSITGKFYFDQSLLQTTPAINPLQPDNARYNPGISALSLDFNQTLQYPAKGEEYLPVKNPGIRTARIFHRLAAMNGVDLPSPKEAAATKGARLLARISGMPLLDIVRLGLEYSNNMVMELIGQMAAKRLTGKTMTLAQSSKTLVRWLQDRLPGTKWAGFTLPNHSGLSAAARVSPAQMASIIRFAAAQRFAGWSYISLLPVSGQRDAMRKRFRDPATVLRLWAKTGTLKYAKGLTGQLHSKKGRRLAFALYITDFAQRRAYDANPRDADWDDAEGWIMRAEALEADLVRKWILKF